MQSEAEDMAFDEHAFFQTELKENFAGEYSWDTHRVQFEKTRDGISRGLELLREAESRQREADDLLKKREKQQRETDGAQRRENELEAVMVQVENEWKEAVYSWNGKNTELKFTPEQMRSLAQFADEYGEDSDFAVVRQMAANLWNGKGGSIHVQMQEKQKELRELEDE